MEQAPERLPIVFVTGVGQTWTSLKGDHVHRWNLFARDKEIIFGGLTAKDRLRFGRVLSGMAHSLLTGKPVNQTELRRAADRLACFGGLRALQLFIQQGEKLPAQRVLAAPRPDVDERRGLVAELQDEKAIPERLV